ncbi:hypothetical protein COMA2_20331 [Candidatus Nitrospira nitrificans]|uniref:Uncharacterized protein n=1 Tax=Candidatus Nitrospira nitrificans TaxID=1742973 RepID=A0A0S4LI04_9BACT|nr:hypothetical protein COMA2_20331 [Candidatus Nitrospira nitrificans]
MVQFHGAVLTAEIPAAPATGHEGHSDSILGFASITLTGAAGFGHGYVSTIGRVLERHFHDMAITTESGASATRLAPH